MCASFGVGYMGEPGYVVRIRYQVAASHVYLTGPGLKHFIIQSRVAKGY